MPNSRKNSNTEKITKNEKEITLKTNLPEEFQIQNNTLTIPSIYDNLSLNKLVKKLLQNDEKTFNFFIDNKILDKPIHNFLLENPEVLKSSEEKSIEIFYSFKLEEPKLMNTIKEDEWIKKISVRKNFNLKNDLEYYCVGLFNSELTIYNRNNEKLFKIKDNNDDEICEILHDVCFFNRENGDNIILKSSRNETETIKIYNVDLAKSSYTQIYKIGKQNLEYVNCLSVNPIDNNYFCAGDTTGNIRLFKIPSSEESKSQINTNSSNASKNKKRKIEASYLSSESVIEKCHENREIVHIDWLNNSQILTYGDDFNLKIWNLNTKTNYLTMNTNHKYVSSLKKFGENLVMTGHDDGRIKFWDLKSGKISNIFSGHSKFVSALDFNEGDESKFVSIGYDSVLNMWDTRANKAPLYSIKTDAEKNYGLAFNTFDYMMCGGDNANVNIYSNLNDA
jgi:WD40 repeat protein